MIEKTALLVVIPIVLFYMSIIARQKIYAYGGCWLLLLLAIIVLPETAAYTVLHDNYSPWVSRKIGFWITLAVVISISLGFIAYAFHKEAEARKKNTPIILRNDFRKLLSPTKSNLFFWVIIVSYYMVCKYF